MLSRTRLVRRGASTLAVAALLIVLVALGFARSMSVGLTFLIILPLLIAAAAGLVILVANALRFRTRRVSKMLGRPAFTLTGGQANGVHRLLDQKTSEMPTVTSVASTDTSIEFWWRPSDPAPIATIPRDRITSITYGSVRSLGGVGPAIIVNVDWLSQPINLIFESTTWYSIGGAGTSEVEAIGRALRLAPTNEGGQSPYA